MQLDSTELQLYLAPYRGGLALLGVSLDRARDRYAGDVRNPSSPLHITLLTAAEYKSLGRPNVNEIAGEIPLNHVYALGEASASRSGSGSSVHWIVVIWNHANAWRKTKGLQSKAFHITLSDEDDHSVDKSVQSLIIRTKKATELQDSVENLGLEAMDHVVLACEGSADVTFATLLAERMIILDPNSFKGYVRLGDLVRSTNTKLSMLAYARAVHLNHSTLLTPISSRIRAMSSQVPYGPITTPQEYDDVPPSLRHLLLVRFPRCLDQRLSDQLWTTPIDPRHRCTFMSYDLPRYFSWVYPGRLAGMSTPRREADIDTLIEMGMTHVLSLTKEEPLDEKWFRLKPLKHNFIPIDNYGTPTREEMDIVYAQVQDGGTWLVHCGGGVGRAGTVLACLIGMFGKDARHGVESDSHSPRLDAREAIRSLRLSRPKSLESERQETFVQEWISHRWKLSYTAATHVSEPVSRCSVQFKAGVTPTCLAHSTAYMLIGRPGSGKSWLSTAILKRRPQGTTIIVSQDESGSREQCERVFGQKHNEDTLVMLDRCNPTIEDRKTWISLSLTHHLVAIYFDYPLELCHQRVSSRLDHPRIRAGRGANALQQMDRQMQAPTLDEGFSAIYTITSFLAARQVVFRICGDPPLIKFPRTPHLLDLGATTSDDIVKADFGILRAPLTIEEKIDGANMGFSLDWDGAIRCQNRSHWVSSADHAQFRPLDGWIRAHDTALRRILDQDQHFPERYILYGEWMVARHSIHYTSLPDHFIAFDLFDRLEGTFLSRQRLTMTLHDSGIAQVPLIAQVDQVTQSQVLDILKRHSTCSDSPIEGVYIRTEDADRHLTIRRGKVVRGDFISGNEHWTRGILTYNVVSEVSS
ncbi:hypothetical protein BD324DRAFT_622037 [Kockovaella imperatae]|uniref:Tyrosine specific protein phosphatases domain-containing protein n=1 Tax=Kockovaella imperatae TaxID=4999 RepID=A0A1Y1UKX9_9TREE|nr:hypothetical protein BD324DRAFT_622037 [Kockovaella imperatae]ORX38713.1 hypothetical protein BD324DRAFT_622037 [Kockovaella imperatae]